MLQYKNASFVILWKQRMLGGIRSRERWQECLGIEGAIAFQ